MPKNAGKPSRVRENEPSEILKELLGDKDKPTNEDKQS